MFYPKGNYRLWFLFSQKASFMVLSYPKSKFKGSCLAKKQVSLMVRSCLAKKQVYFTLLWELIYIFSFDPMFSPQCVVEILFFVSQIFFLQIQQSWKYLFIVYAYGIIYILFFFYQQPPSFYFIRHISCSKYINYFMVLFYLVYNCQNFTILSFIQFIFYQPMFLILQI